MNSIGNILRLTTFGESHGEAIGGIIDGFPSNFPIDIRKVQTLLDLRRPGTSSVTTQRKEPDKVEFLSGISDDYKSLGTSIGFIIRNSDHHSSDYGNLRHVFRPNHADYTYQARYAIREHRGGGRASARETANWVVAGALALQLLECKGIEINSSIISIGDSEDPEKFRSLIENARDNGDSIGGVVQCSVTGIPAGVGDPVFDKLDARLAHAMLSINGAKGFEIGDGFQAARCYGSQILDTPLSLLQSGLHCSANHSGGVQGGISNGMPITFRVPFKPTPTLSLPLQTIDDQGHPTTLEAKGRHDPCIAIRAVHVVKALTAFILADAMLSAQILPSTFRP